MAKKNIIFTNGTTTETTYNDEKIDDLVLFENIRDSNGRNRFIEGNVETIARTGTTYSYTKYSLSGTHLMVVIAGYTTAKIDKYLSIANIYLDTWLMNKIYKINPSSSIVTIAKMIGRTTTPDAINEYSCSLDKVDNSTLRVYVLDDINPNLNTEYFRLQFDLLIDTD